MPRDLSRARSAAPIAAGPTVINISAAGDGTAWAVDKSSTLLRNTGDAVPWQARPGTLADIGVASDGTVYGVGTDGSFLRYEGTWVHLKPPPEAALAAVAVGGSTLVWATDVAGGVHRYDPVAQSWTSVPGPKGGPASSLRATSDGTVCCLSGAALFRFTGGTWSPVPGAPALQTIGVGAAGWIWGVAASGTISQYDGDNRPWPPLAALPDGAQATEISCGDDQTVWALGQAGVGYRFDAVSQGWAALARPAQDATARIGVGSQSAAWAIQANGAVYQYTYQRDGWEPVPVGDPLRQAAAQDATTVWGLDSGGYLIKFTKGPSGWTATPEQINLNWISVSSDGALWGADPQGDMVGFDPAEKVWVPVGRPVSDGPVVQVSSAGDELAMALCDTGNLYRWTGNGFEPAAADLSVGVSSVSVLPGGIAYAVGTDHQLYLYQGTWLPVGGQVAQVSAGAPDDVWCIDLAGNPVHVGTEHATTEAPGWDTESVFDEAQSTHLWLVNRAATLAGTYGRLGADLISLVKPGQGRLGDPFHDNLCQGLYDADWKAPYNDPMLGQPTYKSHFYDPATGKNYYGETDPTALTRGAQFFETSLQHYWRGDLAAAGYNLGLSLHYMTDMTQPMHAGNFTYFSSHPAFGYHTAFENYVMEIQSTVTPPNVYTPSTLGTDPRAYIIAAAVQSKAHLAAITPPYVTFAYYGIDDHLRFLAARELPAIMTGAITTVAQYLIAWITQATSRWTDYGGAARAGAGACTLSDQPWVAVIGANGRLMVNFAASGGRTWADRGGPATTTIAAAIGTTAFGANAYTYLKGADGHLWLNSGNATGGQWSDLGTPAAADRARVSASNQSGPDNAPSVPVSVTTGLGVTATDTSPAAFVLATGAHVYVHMVASQPQWTNLGKPTLNFPVTHAVGAASYAGKPYVAVITADGHLRVYGYTDGGWRWMEVGTPANAKLTAGAGLAGTASGVVATVFGDDGHLWTANWAADRWTWTDQGVPGAEKLAAGVGSATAGGTVYSLVTSNTGHLWISWLFETDPQWADRGAPTATTIADAGGASVAGNRPFGFVIGSDGHLWAQAKSFPAGWQPWTPVAGGQQVAASGARVTALWRDPEHLDMFVTGYDGTVRTTFWEVANAWPGWAQIGTRRMAPGAQIAAVWREPLHLDLFATAFDGTPFTTYWEPASGWQDWFAIGGTGQLARGAPITAVWRPDSSPIHLDLFTTAADGKVQTTFWELAGGWRPWMWTNESGLRSDPAATVAAVWRAPEHIDLFTTGLGGSVLTSWWEPGKGWQAWFRVPGSDQVPVSGGTSVTAVWRPGSSPIHLDLFVCGRRDIGQGGTVYSTFWEPGPGWTGWFPIHVEQELSDVAPVTAQWRGHSLDLFTSGPGPNRPDGGVWTAQWHPETSWQPWNAIRPDSVDATPDGAIPVGWYRTDRLLAFATGRNGGIDSTFWEPPV